MAIEFQVVGEPATQGSKKVVPICNKSGPVVKNGRVLTRAVEDNPKTAEWRQQVASAARQAYDGPLLTGAVSLTLVFERPRPRSHYGTGRNAETLKPSAPQYPTTKPDSVKLTRAVEDALTGVIWGDDSQVCEHRISKRWGQFFRVYVRIEELTPAAPPAEESPSRAGGSSSAFPVSLFLPPQANGKSA